MPNWKIHLEVGKRLNQSLHFNKEDYALFLLGNILPDINNGFIVRDIKTIISHDNTHFDSKECYEHHILFFKKYRDRIKEPLYLGYYVHLMTDYLFSKDFYDMVEKIHLNYLGKEKLRTMKQHDFRLFDNNYNDNRIDLNDLYNVVNKIDLEEVNICESDLKKVMDYLYNTPVFEGEYEIYDEDTLKKLLDTVVMDIQDSLNNMLNV